jgi:hypothetical protein
MVGGGIASMAAAYGFSNRDRMELMRLLALSEHAVGTRRIDEMFAQRRRSASAGTMILRTSLRARRKASGGSTDSGHAAV